MMHFWILQSLLNILLVGLAVSYVLQKRRLLRLEGELIKALSLLKNLSHVSSAKKSSDELKVNTPLGSATSTLSERRASSFEAPPASTSSLSTSARYALAQKLISEGLSMHDVAQKSGISEAELGLLRKISYNPKNIEVH